MKIYIMRHGFAEPPTEKAFNKLNWKWSEEDLARPLKEEGVTAATAIARWMLDKDEVPTRIEHSPAKRAAQTAKIVGKILKAPVMENQNLLPGKPAEMVMKGLADDKANKRVMLVGHSDNLPAALRALNWLTGDEHFEVDPMATAEMRILDMKRKSYTWDELDRVLPSWVGAEDLY